MSGHLQFEDMVRRRWVVKRDTNGDQFIPLNHPCGKLDHVYPVDDEAVGLWMTGVQIERRIRTLQRSVPSLRVAQQGDHEAVVCCGMEDLDSLCSAARAKRRRQVSETERLRLRQISPLVAQTGHVISSIGQSESPNAGRSGGMGSADQKDGFDG